MKEWYALANSLEIQESPLDERSVKRIEKLAAAQLPKRKHRWRVAAVIAAILLLTACGVVAATRFSDWFWFLAANPHAPEESEDILASMGTVIGQSQTEDGITVTLHGALYDGQTLLLSISVEGLEAEERYTSAVKTGGSWLYYSRADCIQRWNENGAEEAEYCFTSYDQLATSWAGSVRMTRQLDLDRCLLLLEPALTIQEGRELVLHLEDLEVMGQTVAGPYEFTFTPEKKDVARIYTGAVELTAESGEAFTVTEIVITPLEVQVFIRGEDQPPEQTPRMKDLQLSGEADTWSSSSGNWIHSNDDGTWEGRLTYGTLERVLDPAAVTAVRIDSTWLELDQWTLVD